MAAAPRLEFIHHAAPPPDGGANAGVRLTFEGTDFGPAGAQVTANVCRAAPEHDTATPGTRLVCTLAPAAANTAFAVRVTTADGTSASAEVRYGSLGTNATPTPAPAPDSAFGVPELTQVRGRAAVRTCAPTR